MGFRIQYRKSKNIFITVLSLFTLNPIIWIIFGIALISSREYIFGGILIIFTIISFYIEDQIDFENTKKNPFSYKQNTDKNNESPFYLKAATTQNTQNKHNDLIYEIIPPPIIDDPDLVTLDPIVQKYRSIINNNINLQNAKEPEWVCFKKALDDVFEFNFESIFFYLEKEVFFGESIKKKEFEDHYKTATTYATSCCWMIGREFSKMDRALQEDLKINKQITINNIPKRAIELIKIAAYFPYWYFANVFSEYYESPYTMHKNQKESHLANTYKVIINCLIKCFYEGVISN